MGDVKIYRDTVLECGIPHRPNGIIGEDDPLRVNMCNDGRPFQKHIMVDGKAILTSKCWCVGDDAAARGIDLRYALAQNRIVIGIVQFGKIACIDQESMKSIHGGAIHTVLDEITAETAKILDAPVCVTSDFSCSIKKPIMSGITYTLESTILSKISPRIFTQVKMRMGNTVVAIGKATLVDLNALKLISQ